MKKIFLFLIPFLFVSCTGGFWTGNWETSITNNTDSNVGFFFDNNPNDIIFLNPNETYKDIINRENKPVLVGNPRAIINYVFKDGKALYDINPIQSIPVRIYNSSDEPIIVSDNNGNLGLQYGESIIIQPKETVQTVCYTLSLELQTFFLNGFPASPSLISLLYF